MWYFANLFPSSGSSGSKREGKFGELLTLLRCGFFVLKIIKSPVDTVYNNSFEGGFNRTTCVYKEVLQNFPINLLNPRCLVGSCGSGLGTPSFQIVHLHA